MVTKYIRSQLHATPPCDYQLRYAEVAPANEYFGHYSIMKPKKCKANCITCLDCPLIDCDYGK